MHRTTRQSFEATCTLLSLLLARTLGAEAVPDYITAALADANRPADDRREDTDRMPAAAIAFADVKPGDKVADFMPGRGYLTRIFCKLVGDAGHVYAIGVPQQRSAPPEPPTHDCSNVTWQALQVRKRPAPELWSSSDDPGGVYEYWSFSPPAENFAAPEPLDVIWAASYRDLRDPAFGAPNMHLVNRALLNALKPGGTLIIEDRVAPSNRKSGEQLQREMLAAGYEFVAAIETSRENRGANAHATRDGTGEVLLKFRRPVD